MEGGERGREGGGRQGREGRGGEARRGEARRGARGEREGGPCLLCFPPLHCIQVYMWGLCRGQAVLSPLLTKLSCVDDIFAGFGAPPSTWRILAPSKEPHPEP